jgi:transitional endoplasmic reticulum ATPase
MVVDHKSRVKDEQAALLEALERLGGKQTAEEDILFQGDKLIVPERMNLADVMRFCGDKIEEDERHMTYHRDYRFRPYDGAWATMQAMKQAFGMVQQKGVRGMFGVTPPSLITINVGPGQTEQVPWGALEIPMLPGVTFELSGYRDKELGTLFRLEAEGPRKWRFRIQGVFNAVEDYLNKHSIYRGKAFDGQEIPDFLDTAAFDPSKVVYAKHVLQQLEANVWAFIKWSAIMRNNGISLKRATLFEGPFGTGKTLGAFMTAKIAVEHGWTFLYCRPKKDNLEEVMATARIYQPAVVFFEDVDTIASGEVPSKDAVTGLLDMFDGITAKDTEIMVVLTTNHAEKIHKGMVRPGRLDAVINIGAPDSDGVERFVRVNVDSKHLSTDIDWDAVGKAMDGYYPAFITEAIQRAKVYNITLNHGSPTVLGTDDFVQAAEGLRDQLRLMEDAPENPPVESLGAVFDGVVTDAVAAVVNRAGMRKPTTEHKTDMDWEFVTEGGE